MGLAPAWLDVLGRMSGPVSSPLAGMQSLPDSHPYARMGSGVVQEAVEFFSSLVSSLDYRGGLEDNMALPTSLGGRHLCAMAPPAMAAGNLDRAGSVAIVGIGAMRDFSACLVAQNLSAGGALSAQGVTVDFAGAGADLGNLDVARRIQEPKLRAQLGAEVLACIGGAERVGFPAVLGLGAHQEVVGDLERILGREVFEIATVPPSVPGLRLSSALAVLRRTLGVKEVIGARVTGFVPGPGGVGGLRVRAASRSQIYEADYFVIASGGVLGGGIEVGHQARSETILGLQIPEGPLGSLGVAVDNSLRPLGPSGDPVFQNVAFAGATVGGADPIGELSSQGICVATGYLAAEVVKAEVAKVARAK